MATKTSILIFYLSLAKDTHRFMKIASHVTLAVVLIAGIVLTFLNIFQCNPVGAVFAVTIQDNATCISLVTLYLVSAPVNIITDVAILVLPIPVLTGMRLPTKQKNILVATFLLGIFVTIVDVIRVYYLQEASFQQETPGLDSSTSIVGTRLGDVANFAWTASLSLMWSAVEVNVGIITACIPTLKPLVKRIRPSWIGNMRNGSFTFSGTHTSKTIDHDMEGQPHQRLASEAAVEPNRFHPLPPTLGGNQEQELGMMDFLTNAIDHAAVANERNEIANPAAQEQEGQEQEMSFADVLNAGPTLNRSDTVCTLGTTGETVYFGFVNMRRPKSMMRTRGRDCWKYCITVTILFFLWGFSYGLLNTLNSKISQIIGATSMAQVIGLQSAYFGAYFFGPLTCGRFVLKTEHGFKSTFITGLCIYAVGILMFWPSAVLYSYAGFVISNFVVGYGLSILETAANPFLALCGASRYMESRLLLAQAVQAAASVISPLLAEKALFTTVNGKGSLIDVQWTYLAIAFFCIILALFFFYMPLPELSNEDLDIQAMHEKPFEFPQPPKSNPHNASSGQPGNDRHIGGVSVVVLTLILGVTAQYLYVADQEAVSQYLNLILSTSGNANIASTPSTLDFLSQLLITHTAFTLGRLSAAGLCAILQPRKVFLAYWLLSVLLAALVFALTNISADSLTAIVTLLYFFQGPLWPITFAITLRGQGRRTKDAAAYLTSGASGGAILPWLMYIIARSNPPLKIQYSYCIVLAAVSLGLLYPLYLNFYAPARALVYACKEDAFEEGNGDGGSGHGREASTTMSLPMSRRFSEKLTGIFQKMRPGSETGSANSDVAVVEHKERRSPDADDGRGDG